MSVMSIPLPDSHPGLVRNDAGAGAPLVVIDRDRRRAELLRLSNKAHVEHMAVLLAFARPTVDLNHVEAPIIFLTTMLDDHDIRFVDIHLAVTRAFELRRDVATESDRGHPARSSVAVEAVR